MSIFFFRIVVDLTYFLYVHPAFADHFLTPMRLSFEFERFLLSYFLLFAAAIFVPFDKKDLSGIFFLSVLMFIYVPMTSMYGFDASLPLFPLVSALVAIGTAHGASKLPFGVLAPTPIKSGEKLIVGIAVSFNLLFLMWVIATGAIANINFDFSKIYDLRETNQELLDVGLMAYVNQWTQKVFNPLLFALALYRRNLFMLAFTLAMQVFFFATTQHRAHLFTPFLIYLVSLLYTRNINLSRLYVIAGVFLGVFLGFTLYFEIEKISAIVMRRAFFVPPSVTFEWFNYFAERPKVYWTDILLANVVPTEYSGERLPFLLGDELVPDLNLGYNTGLIGSGYAHAGIFGVVFYAFILGAILKIVNVMIGRGIPAYIAAALLLGPIRTAWTGSDLLTALLTHGIALAVITLWFLGQMGNVAVNQRTERLTAGQRNGVLPGVKAIK